MGVEQGTQVCGSNTRAAGKKMRTVVGADHLQLGGQCACWSVAHSPRSSEEAVACVGKIRFTSKLLFKLGHNLRKRE